MQAMPGEAEALGISRRRLGMGLFLGSDALTFAALFFAYVSSRRASPDWPRPFDLWPDIALATAMTLVLLGAGCAVAVAGRRAGRGQAAGAGRALGLGALLGLVFVAMHLSEWRHLVAEGVSLRGNPWGEPLFGATFYALTGMHVLHVAVGVVYLAATALRFARGRTDAEGVAVCGLYWHFVEMVWLFLFPLVYLLSIAPRGTP